MAAHPDLLERRVSLTFSGIINPPDMNNNILLYQALNCPGCYLTLGPTSWLQGIKLHYMPDELLRALGDDVSTPLGKRFPLIIRTLAKRMPLALKKTKQPLPRIQK